MADPEAALGHRGSNRTKRDPLRPHRSHGADRVLLSLMLDEIAVTGDTVAERHLAPEIAPTRLLILLHVRDALPDAVALSLSKGGRDGQEELAQAVPGNVAAEVQQMELHPARPELFDDVEGIQG